MAQSYDLSAKGSYVYAGIDCSLKYQPILDNAGDFYRNTIVKSYPYTINIFSWRDYVSLSKHEKERLHIDGEIKAVIDTVKIRNYVNLTTSQWEAVAYYHIEVRDFNSRKLLYEIHETCTRAYYQTEEMAILEVLACVKKSCDGEDLKYSLSGLHGRVVTLDEVKGKNANRVSVEIIPPVLEEISRELGFNVYAKRGGMWQSIGTLKIEDIIAEDRILCKVRKGGKAIFASQENGDDIYVESYYPNDFPSLKNEFYKIKQVKTFSSLTHPKKNCNSVQRLLVLPFNGISGDYSTAFQKSIAYQMTKTKRARAWILEKPLDSYSKNYRDSLCRKYDAFVRGTVAGINTENISNSFYPYKATTKATIEFVDPKSGKIIDHNHVEWTGKGHTQDQAIRGSFSPSFFTTGLDGVVYGLFPITTEIVTIDEVTGAKAKSVTIAVGKDAGVYYNMPFYVFEYIGGDSWQKIGDMKLIFSNQANRAQCKVTNGGKAIKTAIEEGRKVRIMSHPGI